MPAGPAEGAFESRLPELGRHSNSKRDKMRSIAKRRRGSALVEFAVCAPLIALVVVMSIEFSRKIHTYETLHVATYEAGRVGSRPGGDLNKTKKRAEDLLRDRNITNATISIEPADYAALKPGDVFAITVTVPPDQTGSVMGNFFTKKPLGASSTFIKQ